MKSVLYGPVYQNNKLERHYSKNYQSKSYREEVFEVDQNGIKGFSKEIQLNGIILEARDVYAEASYSVKVMHDFPLFKLHFEIEGSNQYVSGDGNMEFLIPSGHYNLFYLPQVAGELRYNTRRRKTLEITFTEAYLRKIIGKDFKNSLFRLGKAIDSKEPFLLWEKSKPVSFELYRLIDEVNNCNFSGNIKKAYLEAKVNEILVVILAQVDKNNVDSTLGRIEEDTSKILKVEDYIKNNLGSGLTIAELSTVAGINTTKLKHDFKQVFSSTVFQYITTLRMQKARVLLLEKGLPVAQVSQEVGYKNPQHFTVAFKKKYGVLPKDLRGEKG